MSAPLTPRELEVVALLSKGLKNKQIAASLGIAERTVKQHVRNLMWKLNIEDRRRVTLAKYWNCQVFRIGAGYESPNSSVSGT